MCVCVCVCVWCVCLSSPCREHSLTHPSCTVSWNKACIKQGGRSNTTGGENRRNPPPLIPPLPSSTYSPPSDTLQHLILPPKGIPAVCTGWFGALFRGLLGETHRHTHTHTARQHNTNFFACCFYRDHPPLLLSSKHPPHSPTPPSFHPPAISPKSVYRGTPPVYRVLIYPFPPMPKKICSSPFTSLGTRSSDASTPPPPFPHPTPTLMDIPFVSFSFLLTPLCCHDSADVPPLSPLHHSLFLN